MQGLLIAVEDDRAKPEQDLFNAVVQGSASLRGEFISAKCDEFDVLNKTFNDIFSFCKTGRGRIPQPLIELANKYLSSLFYTEKKIIIKKMEEGCNVIMQSHVNFFLARWMVRVAFGRKNSYRHQEGGIDFLTTFLKGVLIDSKSFLSPDISIFWKSGNHLTNRGDENLLVEIKSESRPHHREYVLNKANHEEALYLDKDISSSKVASASRLEKAGGDENVEKILHNLSVNTLAYYWQSSLRDKKVS